MKQSPQYWREHYQIRRMKYGQSVPVRNGRLVRVDARTWALYQDGVRSRCRFGRCDQIAEDVAHIEEYGTLPPPSGRPW
jgi:hypothetical protein